MTNNIDYGAIRKRVQDGIKRQITLTRATLFVVNLVLFIAFMLLGWSMALSQYTPLNNGDDLVIGGMVLLSMTGFIGLLFNGISLALESKAGQQRMRERIIAAEMGKALLKLDDEDEEEKAKRTMALSDDGELVEVIEDDVLAEELHKRAERRG
ncbi:MAG: hypothetical protein JNJ61_14075 [Anaerolineae bacterium]|nr:hypothetical protein [Anaerolineae bacterium]